MSKLSYKVSYYVLYALFAIVLVVLGLFYFVGFDRMVGEFNDPVHTDTLLYLIYGILGLCILVTIVAAIFQFGSSFMDSPKKAIKSLLGLILLVLVLVVSYVMGSDTPVLTGDGPYTDSFWLKISDMMIYSIYFLLGVTILAMLASSVKKRLS